MTDGSPQESCTEGSRGDVATEQPPAADAGKAAERPFPWQRTLIVAVLLALVVAMAHQPIRRMVRGAVAQYHSDAARDRMLDDDVVGALDEINQALSWWPGDAALLYQRGQLYANAREWELSLMDFGRLTGQLAPNFAMAYQQRAGVYQEMGRYDDAIADLRRAIKLSPSDNPPLLNHLAYVRALAGIELEEALADVERAIELDPSSTTPAAYLDTRGYVLFQQGHLEAAREELHRAIEAHQSVRSDPRVKERLESSKFRQRMMNFSEGEMRFHLGEVYEALGDAQSAEREFGRSKQLGYYPAPD